MLSLLLKDFYTLKQTLITSTVILIGYNILFLNAADNFVGVMALVMYNMALMTSLTYDNKTNFNLYARALPISLKTFVASKYVLALCLSLVGGAIGLLITIFTRAFLGGDPVNVFSNAEVILTGSPGVVLWNFIALPALFKFGVEKAYLIMFVGVAILGGIIGGGYYILNELGLTVDPNAPIFFVIVVILILIIGTVSYFISLRVVKNKHY